MLNPNKTIGEIVKFFKNGKVQVKHYGNPVRHYNYKLTSLIPRLSMYEGYPEPIIKHPPTPAQTEKLSNAIALPKMIELAADKLASKSLQELKTLSTEMGAGEPFKNKRKKENWIENITQSIRRWEELIPDYLKIMPETAVRAMLSSDKRLTIGLIVLENLLATKETHQEFFKNCEAIDTEFEVMELPQAQVEKLPDAIAPLSTSGSIIAIYRIPRIFLLKPNDDEDCDCDDDKDCQVCLDLTGARAPPRLVQN